MRDHTKLTAFTLADELAVLVYQITRSFPRDETYGLTSQMRRAAVSIPSNIVEGCARQSRADYFRFPEIAFGSLRELHYQYRLAKRLGYVDDASPDLELKMEETERVLCALTLSMRKDAC